MENEVKRYVVPEGMRLAAGRATNDVDVEGYILLPGLEAAVRWLAENPIVPTREQARLMHKEYHSDPDNWSVHHYTCWVIAEWQRRMLLVPDLDPQPAMPEEIMDLIIDQDKARSRGIPDIAKAFNAAILTAFWRGRAGK